MNFSVRVMQVVIWRCEKTSQAYTIPGSQRLAGNTSKTLCLELELEPEALRTAPSRRLVTRIWDSMFVTAYLPIASA